MVRAWRQCRGIENRNPLIVYQMGKVGSTSVAQTLQALDTGVPVLHCHALELAHVERAMARTRSSTSPGVPQHLFVSLLLARKLRVSTFPCRLVTLTREPIARAISFVFEDWRKKAPSARRGNDLQAEVMRAAVDELLAGDNGIADPSLWFDRELKSVFGIDVFAQPYDFENGYVVYRCGNVSLLLMRMEDLDRALPAALSAFLGVDARTVPMLSANRASAKWYAESLKAFTKTYVVPPEIHERAMATRYARHFYSTEAAQQDR